MSDKTLGCISIGLWNFLVKNEIRGEFLRDAEKMPFKKVVSKYEKLKEGVSRDTLKTTTKYKSRRVA